jgi:hypothetical protein
MISVTFENEEPLDGVGVRNFMADRRDFPWFGRGLSVPFVDGIQGARLGDLALLVYTYGTVPTVGSPFPPSLRSIQQTILEARPTPWPEAKGSAQPRKRWDRLASLMGRGEVPCPADPAFTKRFRLTAPNGFPARVLHDRARAAMLATDPSTSFAWSASRVMIHRPERLAGRPRDEFLSQAITVLQAWIAS